jgi:hypothetical protein
LALFAGAAFCLALFLSFRGLGDGARASTRAQPLGTVESVVNDARRRPDGVLAWSPVRGGSEVHDGDALFVGADSEAVVVYADGSRLEIEPNSMVVLRAPVRPGPGPAPPPALEVVRGAVVSSATSGPLGVRARGTSLQLRSGSRARVTLDPGGTAQVDVAAGQAMAATPAGTLAIPESHRQVLGPDGTPRGPARALAVRLAAPADGARVFYVTRRPDVRFRWAAPGAGGPVRFELSREPSFRDPLVGREVSGAEHTQPGLGAGTYYWRVRAGDAASEERRLTVVAERLPALYAPGPDDVVQAAGTVLVFSWTPVGDERDYVLEVDRDERFAAPVAEVERNGLHHAVAAQLPEGRHCARVRHAGRRDAPWSAPRCFEILHKPRLGAPQLLDPTLDRGRDEARAREPQR